MKNLYRSLITLTALLALLPLAGCLSSGTDSNDAVSSGDPGGSAPPPPPPPGNSAPTISGNPSTSVKVDDPYSFTPNASDPDGDTMTFSIENQPGWASFDSNSGQLSGTPMMGDIGSFADIRITVSDGQISSSMPDFTIDVTQIATASVTVSWTAPTQNEDGSALNDLAGYKIYYGRSSGSYSDTIQIDNPGLTMYVVENLSPDTYFIAATAFNDAGTESGFSGEAVATVN